MPFAQFLRIETAAGGIASTNRQFIKAARAVLSSNSLGFEKRKARHSWLREGLALRTKVQRLNIC